MKRTKLSFSPMTSTASRIVAARRQAVASGLRVAATAGRRTPALPVRAASQTASHGSAVVADRPGAAGSRAHRLAVAAMEDGAIGHHERPLVT